MASGATAGDEPAELDDTAGDGPVETRRERQRRETVEEIKAAAREHLRLESSSQFSLRAVARDVGLTPSAIYRYFASQRDLVAAVADDAFAAAGAAMRRAADSTEGRPSAERLLALGHAYRGWAQANKAEFNLIFGTDLHDLIDGPGAVHERTLAAFFEVPVEIYVDGVRSGEIEESTDPGCDHGGTLTRAARSFAAKPGVDLDPQALDRLISAWSGFHGFVALELFGHLRRLYTDPEAAFEQHLMAMLVRAGASGARV